MATRAVLIEEDNLLPVRTSITHPLQIAEIRPAPAMGKLGLTLCPGKKQAGALTGPWDRDLCLDLDVVAAWNAAAVVTLVEGHELDRSSERIAHGSAEEAALVSVQQFDS